MCTRIQWSADGQPVLVGRNMDWTARQGTKLWVFPKGDPTKWPDRGKPADLDLQVRQRRRVHLGLLQHRWCERNRVGSEYPLSRRSEVWPARSRPCRGCRCRFGSSTTSILVQPWQRSSKPPRRLQVRPVNLLHKGVPVESPVHMSVSDSTNDSASHRNPRRQSAHPPRA